MGTLGEWRKFPEIDTGKDKDLGKPWKTVAAKQVKEVEHKTDFGSMRDSDEGCREKARLSEKLSNFLFFNLVHPPMYMYSWSVLKYCLCSIWGFWIFAPKV